MSGYRDETLALEARIRELGAEQAALEAEAIEKDAAILALDVELAKRPRSGRASGGAIFVGVGLALTTIVIAAARFAGSREPMPVRECDAPERESLVFWGTLTKADCGDGRLAICKSDVGERCEIRVEARGLGSSTAIDAVWVECAGERVYAHVGPQIRKESDRPRGAEEITKTDRGYEVLYQDRGDDGLVDSYEGMTLDSRARVASGDSYGEGIQSSSWSIELDGPGTEQR